MASAIPAKRANGFAWVVQARDADWKCDASLSTTRKTPDPGARGPRLARLVARVGITEASRQRDERDGTVAGLAYGAWIDTYVDPSSGIWHGVNDSGREAGRRTAETYIRPRLGKLPVSAITDDDVAQWMVWMAKQPAPRGRGTLSAKTIRNHHVFLTQILTAASARGQRTDNPARDQKPTRQARKRPMVVLTQDEFETLMHITRPEWRPFSRRLAGSGMRFGEATALT